MASRFARPDTEVLKISRGDTLTVKRRLNAVDSRRLRAMAELPTLAEPGLVMAYLVDWSLVDDAGKRVVIEGKDSSVLAAALDDLDEDEFDEIYAAVKVHVAAIKAEREQEKNDRAGGKNEPVISPLPYAATGVLTGSVS
jgi:hypothetical protein